MTQSGEMKADKTIDCKGLSCPVPIIKTKLAMDSLENGQVLEMVATDKGSKPDIAAFVEETGNILVSMIEQNGIFRYWIQKRGV